MNRQKSVSTGSADRVLSSPVVTQASQKGKKEAVTKLTGMLFTDNHSLSITIGMFFSCVCGFPEANGFRDWCKSECLRLLGSEGKKFIYTVGLNLFLVLPCLSHFL